MTNIEPITRREAFLAAAAAGDAGMPPKTREEVFLQNIAEAVGAGGGGGEGVTPAAIVTATGNMTANQKSNTRSNLGAVGASDLTGYEQKPTVQTISGTTASFAASANTIYKCGELTALTITSIPATGAFTVIFTSGSTPTTFTEPSGMVMPDGFSVETNKRYEINVFDGYAVVASWAVSST